MNKNVDHYRKGVGIVLFNEECKIFIGKRCANNHHQNFSALNDAWQMPQGGIDAGESPEQAALREMAEEIGTNKGKIIAISQTWLQYDFPNSLQNNIWQGQFKGQNQKWFLIKFLGSDADIQLNQHIQEFSEWMWAEIDEVMNRIVDFKKDVYKKVFEEFELLIKR